VVHVIEPFSGPGSTLLRVVDELAHTAPDVRSVAVLSAHRAARAVHAENVLADFHRYCPREWFTRRELMVDAAMARLGLPRHYLPRYYRPAIDAAVELRPRLVLLYEGYYALTSLPLWRRALPATPVVLYVHNPVSRTLAAGGAATAARGRRRRRGCERGAPCAHPRPGPRSALSGDRGAQRR